MNHSLLKGFKIFIFFAGILLLFNSCKSRLYHESINTYPESKLNWKLGAQAYTFNRFTFFEAIDKIDSSELKYVEAFPSQNVGGGIAGKMDFKMDESKRRLILEKLKEKGVKLQAYGVVKINDASEWRQVFEFCKFMGVETITAEPKIEDLPLLSQLCDEYEINVAIHNHPTPSQYWNPDAVLSALEGQSKRIGAAADVGHWIRSGLDPIESLKKLEGRVLHLHLKDLNEKNNRKAHDVVWGTGISDIEAIVMELKRQKFKGMISVEYEYNWLHNRAEVAQSVSYFRSLIRN